MNERIAVLLSKTLKGEMYTEPKKTQYDEKDELLSPMKKSAKRVCEFILNQDFLIEPESCFTGFIRFDESVEGDIFHRMGHPYFAKAFNEYYSKPVENLLTFEWQHSAGDFGKIINIGISGVKKEIEGSMASHSEDAEGLEFLETQMDFCNTLIKRAHKGSAAALKKAEETENAEYRQNLLKLSEALKKIPEYPAENFYEALLSLYFCYGYLPDSIGLIDRYLYPFYKKDIESGVIDDDTAKEYLQELFLMLQARIHKSSDRFYRGGETHFCVGGYNEQGEDYFNEFSRLIVNSVLELPTWIPQISLRWTRKTPREVFEFMLDCERKDPHKRVAFVNDEPRIKGLMEYMGLTFKEAVNYTMIGCNEIALPGGMVLGFDMFNILRTVEDVFHKKTDDVLKCNTYDEFYAIFEQTLFDNLWKANEIGAKLQGIRNGDVNIVSNIFLKGTIERARCMTKGGLARYIAVGMTIGISNVIDSLSITKQFVFDEKLITMEELVDALHNNWAGFEDLRSVILKKGNFFGNDDETSNGVARALLQSLKKWNTGDNHLGKKWLFGNLIGYVPHHKIFGSKTKATPDGRFDGDMTNFGIGQSEGKDRNGLTALLNSIATCDPDAVLTGPSVTNILIDEKLLNDDNFEKTVSMLETYFKNGGTHFQLNYVSREDLLNAKKEPEKYKNLRVRVSGFSDYFMFLDEGLQDEIVKRTMHAK